MMIEKLQSYIRSNHWWGFKAAPILGFTYLYFSFFEFPFSDKLLIFLLSAMTILGIAGFGYVINDIYDIEVDRKAGKKNPFEGKSTAFIFFVISVLVFIALLPWYFLKSNWSIWIALSFQMILYFLYAHPLTRLKEKSIWGPICDALYGHAVPIIIACLTYQQYINELPYHQIWFFSSLFLWQFFKGLRNIFLHQLEDYDNDIKSGVQTITTQRGRDKIYQKTLFVIQPIEIVFLVLFLGSITSSFPSIWLFLGVFLLLYVFGHGVFRNVVWDSKVYSNNTYLYFINNFYETYLPYFFLVFCIINDPYCIVLLMLHVLLFPSTIQMMMDDYKRFLKEIWIQIDNFASRVKKSLQKKDI